MWTQSIYEEKSDRVHPHGPAFPSQLVSHSPTHWITQDAILDMIDAIDTYMHARPGDAELIPWLLVLDCATQHVVKEFRSIMRDTRPHIKMCYVQRNFTGYTQPLDWAYMRAFKNSIRQVVVESNFERVNLDSDSCCSHPCTQQHRMNAARNIELLAGASSIGTRWSSVSFSQKQNAFWRRETCFHQAQPEEPHAPDAVAEATDSEPEAHVTEPLADDHSSDDEDAPTGVEESAAPAVAAAPERAAMSLLERLQAIRVMYGSKPPS